MKNFSGIIIGTIAAVVVVTGGLLLLQRQDGRTPQTAGATAVSALTALETFYDFGTISMAAGKVSYEFKLKNEGSDSAVVSKLYTSCMCTTVELTVGGRREGPFGMPGHGIVPSINVPIGAGEEAVLKVTFDPAAHGPAGVGPIQRQVTVEQKGRTPVVVGFRAMVTP
ncbi:hypothetical protein A3J36_03630 [Candidatus Uhrbacteria bacterium RIFCSPLOWO2_02_FULL_54_37]|uniref:DUF1573 domain-containing protein n=1 Tax=Candidatus Uhrbacteria bacterium RIFCSPLOWO2_02_FULL_54_37 TaxID=1802412 RepID=A0A1F7VK70_9BACT|nr:MAG: hypothetical protein A3J36_03630 [Candidatus Uhrbacteria bacterium RIFCSPLOWO2_02_FULL_54_37]